VGRKLLAGVVVTAVLMAGWTGTSHGQGNRPADDAALVRAELERLYEANAAAFARGDLQALLDLRAPDFHSIAPDSTVRDRAALSRYMQGIINGVRKWNQQTITIDSLRVVPDTAYAVVSQYLDRMALRADNRVHRIESWVTQRETWIRSGRQWLLWRVDQLRNQRRLVDGQPG
jgi:ketosteroid isomerase-like protein